MNLDNYLIRKGPFFPQTDKYNVARSRKIAKAHWGVFGVSYSYLCTKPDDNAKLSKSDIATFGLSLAPANVTKQWRDYIPPEMWESVSAYLGAFANGVNVCAHSTPECRKGCLNTAGKGGMDKQQRGRIIKTFFVAMYPQEALNIWHAEMVNALRVHNRILFRWNVIADLSWELIAPSAFAMFGDRIDFYDYTKDRARADSALRRLMYLASNNWPANYRLVYSISERDSEDDIRAFTDRGHLCAMVFAGKPPETYNGIPVINGDLSDDRFHDPAGHIVGLKAKGKMRRMPIGGMIKPIPVAIRPGRIPRKVR